MNQNARGVDDLAVGGTGCSVEIGKNVPFEGFNRGGHVVLFDDTVGDESAESVDRRPTRLHDRRSTEAFNGFEQQR